MAVVLNLLRLDVEIIVNRSHGSAEEVAVAKILRPLSRSGTSSGSSHLSSMKTALPMSLLALAISVGGAAARELRPEAINTASIASIGAEKLTQQIQTRRSSAFKFCSTERARLPA